MCDPADGRVLAQCSASIWCNGEDLVTRHGWTKEYLNCGSLLQEFDRDRVSKNRFDVMKSHEEMEDE